MSTHQKEKGHINWSRSSHTWKRYVQLEFWRDEGMTAPPKERYLGMGRAPRDEYDFDMAGWANKLSASLGGSGCERMLRRSLFFFFFRFFLVTGICMTSMAE